MISKTADSETGNKIVVEGGKILEKTEVGCQKGTSITVRNLFFNTPVRYKFLKRDFTEAGYIEDIVTKIALVNKDVAIKLINTGKVVLQTNGNGDYKNIVYSIYGKDIASNIIDIDYEYEDMKVTGVIGKPEISRANRSYQIFFVNGRNIKDKNLTAAAEQAYKGMIPIGKYGFIILNIEMNPAKVDVNVHPAKLEVRFEEENKVFKAIYHAIKSGLGGAELIEKVDAQKQEEKQVEENKEIEKVESVQNINLEKEEIKDIEEKENSILKLLNKLKRDDEETKEELENNKLREIFEFREGLKQIGVMADTAKVSDSQLLNEIIEEKQSGAQETMVVSVAEEENKKENLEQMETMRVDHDKAEERIDWKAGDSKIFSLLSLSKR